MLRSAGEWISRLGRTWTSGPGRDERRGGPAGAVTLVLDAPTAGRLKQSGSLVIIGGRRHPPKRNDMRHLQPRSGTASATCTVVLGTLLAACVGGEPSAAIDAVAGDPSGVDSLFADFGREGGPGCSVAASLDGREVLARGYGMAELEHRMPVTPGTVFEAGSVSKQLVAAATILLAIDGRISLDDDIAPYFPELPDFGEVTTIRDLIHHTNGMREWSSIVGIHGWQRTTRLHTHTHVLDVAARQSKLNFPVGDYYFVHEHRIQLALRARGAGHRALARRLLTRADLRASRHEPNAMAR